MKISSRPVVVLGAASVLVALMSLVMVQQGSATPPTMVKISYAKQIAPIVKAKCVSCHNAKRHPEKVDLSSYDAVMASGDDGKIVIAGHPEKSSFFTYVDGSMKPRMPLRAPALSNRQIALIKLWIKSGAHR